MSQDQWQAVIEDEESFNDFRDALSDNAPHVEALVALLRLHPDDTKAVADLFRVFHNIKGDASLCRLGFLVPFMHSVETLLARVRALEVPFSCALADVLLLSVDRLQQAIDMLASREPTSDLHLPEFTVGLEGLHAVPASAMDAACLRLIDAMIGVISRGESVAPPDLDALWNDRGGDLAFFHQLALQLESRSALFEGRTERNLKLALLTNQMAGGWVDADQLCAAVYLHDVGMMLLPEVLWMSSKQLSAEQRQQMSEHAGWGAGLLARMPGWEDAAQMILQHHEKPDGSGYPQGLPGAEIVPGAKILALVDAFEAVMVKQGVRGQPRSTLRAAAEVNAADHQFDKAWVEPFNRAIRHLIEPGLR
jgi:hypothetical protein